MSLNTVIQQSLFNLFKGSVGLLQNFKTFNQFIPSFLVSNLRISSVFTQKPLFKSNLRFAFFCTLLF